MRPHRFAVAVPLAAALLLGLPFAASHAKTADAAQVRAQDLAAQAANARASAAPPWWAGFHEAPLAALQAAARAHALQHRAQASATDTELAAAYVTLRVLNVRWQFAEQRVDSLAVQTAPRADAERFAFALRQERDRVVASMLAPALALHELPLFDAPTPTRLPRAILRARADVGAAEQRLLLARKSAGASPAALPGMQVLAGWIALDAETPSTQPEAAPDASELLEVATQAEGEVRAELRSLNEHAAEAGKRLEIVRMRRIELDAALRRVQLGAGSLQELAQDFERLLADNDQLAIAGGELAYSWIALQHSTAGLALQFER